MLNCTSPVSDPTPGMALNCNLRHLSHLGNIGDLGHLGHLGHLRHLGHLGHLGYLGNIGNLDTLDPYPLDPAPTDSLSGAFITEMDPTDPGPSEGCYADDSLNPLHTRTLESTYTSYTSHDPRRDHTRQIDALDGVTNLYVNGLCTKVPQNRSGDPLCLLFASYSPPLSFAIASLLMYGTRDAAD
jgi:hypothetical protein